MKFFYFNIKISGLFLFWFLFGANAIAQKAKPDLKRMFDDAELFLDAEEYHSALPLFLAIDSLDPDNFNAEFKIGLCYLKEPKNRLLSLPYFKKANDHVSSEYKDNTFTEKKAPLINTFYLGQAYSLNSEFDKAIENYEAYKNGLRDDEVEMVKEVDLYIKYAQNAKLLVANPLKIKIENLGKEINTEFPEYAPVISADESTLIFTSRRPGNKGGKLSPKDGLPYEDVFISKKVDGKWTTPESIGDNINTNGHEASIGLSPDGQELYLYKDDIDGGGNIYHSPLEGDVWGVPQFLDNVNTFNWEPSASPSADGELLYFTSDMKEGLGGRDIWVSKKLPNGEWSLPTNLGPKINTPYDEDGPFIHPDGKTLFFSSKSHTSMGGFDIFFSVLDDETKEWGTPVNVGYPVNSIDDDLYYNLTADGKRAYYSAFHEDGYGEKDIYMLEFIEQKEVALAMFKGVIRDKDGFVPENALVIVTDNESGELLGTYKPNAKTGEYLIILPPGVNYNIAYEARGYIFKSENLEIPEGANYSVIEMAIELPKIEIGKKIILKNIFFDVNKATLRTISVTELNKAFEFLKTYPNVNVEISGHTDNDGSDEYNKNLSQQRAQAVVDYLSELGIDRKRMIAKGYGKDMPLAPNNNPDGTKNLENMQQNRRVELEVIGI